MATMYEMTMTNLRIEIENFEKSKICSRRENKGSKIELDLQTNAKSETLKIQFKFKS
jgi:hypothetical protein